MNPSIEKRSLWSYEKQKPTIANDFALSDEAHSQFNNIDIFVLSSR